MIVRTLLVIMALLFSYGQIAWAQQGDSAASNLQSLQEQFKGTTSQATSSIDKVQWESKLSKNVVPAGSRFKAAILLHIEQDWHINAHKPTLDYLIGTSVSIDGPSAITLKSATYPKAKTLEFDFAGDAIDVYENTAPVILDMSVPDTLSPGVYTIKGKARIQACNNIACLSPVNMNISFPVEVTPKGTGFQAINNEIFQDFEAQETSLMDAFSAGSASQMSQIFNDLGLFWAFTGIFLIGLALNLTPCVYPMLSVTVSLFGGQSDNKQNLVKSASMATVYVLGIIAMYSVLGIIAAYTGSLFGSWLQSPWVLGGIGLLILLLSLSMFGLYELQPPQWLLQNFSGIQRSTSAVGHFFSGLFVGIFAAPCVGPPIIALLAFVGTQGDPVFGFSTLFVMASGLAFPYLILGTFSGLLSKLPKSGTWMVWVKKVFGVILAGVGLFYLVLAVYPGFASWVIPVVLFAGGVYLAMADRSAGSTFFKYVRWSVAAAAVIAAFMFTQNLTKPGVKWQPYSEDTYQQALMNEQPIMLDFYADWCVPCLELDRITFTNEKVIEASQNFKRLKVDLTQYESERAQKLRKQFDVMGVPTIIFINPDGTEAKNARVVGFLKPEAFLDKVANVNAPKTASKSP